MNEISGLEDTAVGLEFEVSEVLKRLALDENVKSYVLQYLPLYQILLQAALRFIGGETLA